MNVIINPDVRQYFYELQYILYEKDYFSYYEDAERYVEELIEAIKKNLPSKLKRKASKHFTDRYGSGLYYAIFPKSKRTQWYVFFRMYRHDGEIYYHVRHIENNHTTAQYF